MLRDVAAARSLAVELGRAAGRLQVEHRVTGLVHRAKAHANDLVSDVDLASEALIADGISALWPDDELLAEEGASAPGSTGWRWVIDPLDGTRNYLTGAGPWSVSIALQRGETTQVAVVHDPATGETFSAVAGGGAVLGDQPIRASPCSRLGEAIVGLSFNPSQDTKRRMGELIPIVLSAVGDIRRIPAALHLSYLAAGRFDAGVLRDTRLWDIAAGLLIAAEAGVRLGGVHADPTPGLTVAAAPGLWSEFSALVASAPSPRHSYGQNQPSDGRF